MPNCLSVTIYECHLTPGGAGDLDFYHDVIRVDGEVDQPVSTPPFQKCIRFLSSVRSSKTGINSEQTKSKPIFSTKLYIFSNLYCI